MWMQKMQKMQKMHEVAKCVQWVLILGMLMHASFGFTSSLHVIPSQCQAFMASVARD